MPSYLHETLVEMFRDRPELAAQLLAGPLGVDVPEYHEVRLSTTDLTEVVPTEYRADLVILLNRDDATVLALVVEVQLRTDLRKRQVWPAYVAVLHARLCCPVVLLVVCPTSTVSAWCGRPIVVGNPGLVLTPVVLGPDTVPVVTDPATARANPELAILSAMAHGPGPDRAEVLAVLPAALGVVDPAHARLYADIVIAALPAAARNHLEALVKSLLGYEYQTEFVQRWAAADEARRLADEEAARAAGMAEGLAEGVAQGLAEGVAQGVAQGEVSGQAAALLMVLDARGLAIPDQARTRITGCTDVAELQRWVRRAATADRVEDLFG